MSVFGLLLILAGAAVVARCATQYMADALKHRPLRILAASIVFMTAIVVAITAPATVAEVTTLPLVRPLIAGLTSCALAVVAWWMARSLERRGRIAGGADRFLPVAPPEDRVRAAGCGLEGCADRGSRRAPIRSRYAVLAAPPLLLAGFAALGLHALAVFAGLVSPPTTWDGVYYHLPTVLRWWQQGRCSIVPGVVDMSEGFNGDVWLLLAAYVGWEPLFELAFVPFGLLLSVAIYALARELGAGRRGAMVAAGLVLVTPLVVLQMYSSYVDLFGTAFTVCAFLFALRCSAPDAATGRSRFEILLCGLSAGLAAGTKLVFLIWLSPVLAWVALRVAYHAWVTRAGRAAALVTRLVLLLAGLLPGTAFWYFRATYHTGWPLYPFVVRVAGHAFGSGLDPTGVITPDVPHAGLTALLYPWFEWKARGYPYSVGAGVGPAVATFGVVGALYLLTRAWKPGATGGACLATVGFLLVGGLLYVTVLQSLPRYALTLWVLLLAAGAPLLDLLLRRARRVALPLLAATVVLSAAFTAVPVARRGVGVIRLPKWSRAAFYEVPPLLDDLAPGTVVLNLAHERMNFALFGARWTNNVIWSSLAKKWGLEAPLTAAQLARHGVEVVYQRGDGPAPFAADVDYRVLFDDTDDPGRRQTTAPTRVYKLASTLAQGAGGLGPAIAMPTGGRSVPVQSPAE